MLFIQFQSFDRNCVTSYKDTPNFCVSVHMNPVATHEFSGDFANDLKLYLDSIDSPI